MGVGGTHVPDMTFILIQVFVNFVHQNGEICARKGILVPDNGTGEILPHLALKLAKLSVT